jgi:CMP-2-keto-3-deoxyoctulosonic acid synthetase
VSGQIFPVGSKVKCVDAAWTADRLTINKTYKVLALLERTSENFVTIVDDNGIKCLYFARRFAPVPEAEKEITC